VAEGRLRGRQGCFSRNRVANEEPPRFLAQASFYDNPGSAAPLPDNRLNSYEDAPELDDGIRDESAPPETLVPVVKSTMLPAGLLTRPQTRRTAAAAARANAQTPAVVPATSKAPVAKGKSAAPAPAASGSGSHTSASEDGPRQSRKRGYQGTDNDSAIPAKGTNSEIRNASKRAGVLPLSRQTREQRLDALAPTPAPSLPELDMEAGGGFELDDPIFPNAEKGSKNDAGNMAAFQSRKYSFCASFLCKISPLFSDRSWATILPVSLRPYRFFTIRSASCVKPFLRGGLCHR
jgi:hypothetical protein